MATYPNTQVSVGNQSPANRNDLYYGEDLYMLDREQTSFVALFNLGRDFVLSKANADNYRDFYSGSIGSTLLDLLSGYSEFNAYNAIVARREDYLYEAQLRSSGVALSSNLGYSVFRGNNVKLTLHLLPTTDVSIYKYDIIGSVNNYDIISLEEKDLRFGEETDLLVVLGTLKVASLKVEDKRTYDFRFNQDKISDDIRLKLDGSEVPTSKILYDLLDDYFVIMSNPVGGIDVRYLNRFQPERWVSYNQYTFYDYVLPTYDWKPLTPYEVGEVVSKVAAVDGLPIIYECVQAGTSLKAEPSWNEEVDAYTSDGVMLKWKCLGRLKKQLYFRVISPGVNISGGNEPIWPIKLGATITDGNVTWICTDTFEQSKFFYNTGSELELTYVELEDLQYSDDQLKVDVATILSVSVETKYQNAETLDQMKRNAPLYNETRYTIRGREDYRKIFRMLMPNAIDSNGFDPIPAVVNLSYVKDHTNKTWRQDTRYEKGAEVVSSQRYMGVGEYVPNAYVYRALTEGYGGLSKKGLSGEQEPNWLKGVDLPSIDVTNPDTSPLFKVYDNQVLWLARYPESVIRAPERWQPNYEYVKGDLVYSNNTGGLYFEAYGFITEPVWPQELGATIQDNEVTWVCYDTIYFDGYNAKYWVQDNDYNVGDFVQPVSSNGYFYKCVTAGKTGKQEPDWVTIICEECKDNEVVWQCYDRLDAPKYVKNHVLEQLEVYSPYGVSPAILDDPVMVTIYLKFEIITHSLMDKITVNNDIFEILDKYQRILATYVDTQTLENLIEELPYVKIARATIEGNTKTVEWKPGTLYRVKDVVTVPESEYMYVANRIETGGYGYTQWKDRSYSGDTEPEWNSDETLAFDTFEDKNLLWELRYTSELGGIIPSYWEPDTVYALEACVMPTNRSDTKLYAKVKEVKYKELEWPTKPGTSILDGRVYWTCLDPKKVAAPLGWNEYYMFSWRTELSRYTKK